jgi:predicted acetyltransferase
VPQLLSYRPASLADSAYLAEMNRRLIEDEGYRNPMTVAELTTRMEGWLAKGYAATLFSQVDRVVAYALWREEADWIYLRHFFVGREVRREGIGRAAFRLLNEEIWPPGKRVRVSVLVGNLPAIAFWRAVGFADHHFTLEMER